MKLVVTASLGTPKLYLSLTFVVYPHAANSKNVIVRMTVAPSRLKCFSSGACSSLINSLSKIKTASCCVILW